MHLWCGWVFHRLSAHVHARWPNFACPGSLWERLRGCAMRVAQNGYTLNGRVIRPADVATFRAPA